MNIPTFDYASKTLIVLAGANSGVSLRSFVNAIGMLVVVASTNVSIVFLFNTGILKTFS